MTPALKEDSGEAERSSRPTLTGEFETSLGCLQPKEKENPNNRTIQKKIMGHLKGGGPHIGSFEGVGWSVGTRG